MIISRKTLALLAAAAIGTSLAACHRGSEDKSASSQDTNQAPKQGYTGPASPSTSPPSSSSGTENQSAPSSGDNQTGSPGSTNPSNSQQQPGGSTQNQPQQR